MIVGAAIFLSRIAGLIRERVFAHYFGNSLAADAFKAALRIPNLLQNLFGEGVLSASFIPVYARLRAAGKDKEAAHVASAVASLLALLVSVLVAIGVLATPLLIDLIAPGFVGEKREATIQLVRILFPGTGLLVASAWCLGVLNSHRKFFLSYAAPVLWNFAQIAFLLLFGRSYVSYALASWVAWGAVAGSALQFAIQVPTVLSLLREFRPSLETSSQHLREVLRNFGPVVLGRGVVQISAYIDSVIASWLPAGAVAAIAYAQILYTLPVSMFGMAVSAAELPEMSSLTGHETEVFEALRTRIARAILRIAYFIVPTIAAFLCIGDLIAGVLFQTGKFTRSDSLWVWTILAGSTIGLFAATLGRLYASAFYALRDTRTPLRFALIRLLLTGALGWLFAIVLPPRLAIPLTLGAAGLTASAGIAGWIEFLLLRRKLHQKIGKVPGGGGQILRLWAAAACAAVLSLALKYPTTQLRIRYPMVLGLGLIATYGTVYLGATWLLGVEQARELVGKLRRKLGH
jgi:putative peptidoglycan lipid II flippase